VNVTVLGNRLSSSSPKASAGVLQRTVSDRFVTSGVWYSYCEVYVHEVAVETCQP
jgi:hypothetical protein